MTQPTKIICDYCKTSNPWEAATCLACGGPLNRPSLDLEPKVATLKKTEQPKQPQTEAVNSLKLID